MAVLSPKLNLPVADYERPWDGRIARARVLDWCKKKIQAHPTQKEIDAECASQAFLLRRDGEPDYTREAWDLPYADVVEGRLMIVPRGVKALASGHGVQAVQDVSEGEQERMRRSVCQLYDRVRRQHRQMPPCPFEKGSKVTRPISGGLMAGNPFAEKSDDSEAPADAAETKRKICALYRQLEMECPFEEDKADQDKEEETAAAEPTCNCDGKQELTPMYASASGEYSRTAAGIPVIGRKAPVKPPLEWFASPEFPLDKPEPLTIDADGRVHGHGALWDSCHAGYADRCIPVPHSAQDYKFFHRGAVETNDGVLVAVGHLTVGGGHADENGNLRAASEHYDNAGTTVAVVAAHEDRWGVYLAGSLVPEATPEQIALLRRSPLSGDWRAFDGNLELVAMHGVNVPGFGVDRPRVAVAASGVLIFPGLPKAETEEPKAPVKKDVVFTMDEIDSRISLAASALLSKPAV